MQNYLSYTVTVSEQRPQVEKQRGTIKTAAVVFVGKLSYRYKLTNSSLEPRVMHAGGRSA